MWTNDKNKAPSVNNEKSFNNKKKEVFPKNNNSPRCVQNCRLYSKLNTECTTEMESMWCNHIYEDNKLDSVAQIQLPVGKFNKFCEENE